MKPTTMGFPKLLCAIGRFGGDSRRSPTDALIFPRLEPGQLRRVCAGEPRVPRAPLDGERVAEGGVHLQEHLRRLPDHTLLQVAKVRQRN